MKIRTQGSPGSPFFGRSGGTPRPACRFLCQTDQRPQSFIDGFFGREYFGHIGTQQYEIGAFAVFFIVLAADSHAKVFPFILRAEFIGCLNLPHSSPFLSLNGEKLDIPMNHQFL
jgi:hypothetical protein